MPEDDDARFQLARSCANKGKFFLWQADLTSADKQYEEAAAAFTRGWSPGTRMLSFTSPNWLRSTSG